MISKNDLKKLNSLYLVRDMYDVSIFSVYENINIKEGYTLLNTDGYTVDKDGVYYLKENIEDGEKFNKISAFAAANAFDKFNSIIFDFSKMTENIFVSAYYRDFYNISIILYLITKDISYIKAFNNQNISKMAVNIDTNIKRKYEDTIKINAKFGIIYYSKKDVIIREKYADIEFKYYTDLIILDGKILPVILFKLLHLKNSSDINEYLANIEDKTKREKIKEEYCKLVYNSTMNNI